MDVRDRLPGVRTVVENGPVTARQPLLGGNLLGHQEQVSDKGLVFLREGVEVWDGLAGYDQDVRGCLGVDVAQGHAPVVLVKDLPWLLPIHNLLEQRLLLGHKEQTSG